MLANRSMPAGAVIPVLGYDDVGEAAEWLCETFGFTERWRAGSHRAQLAVGDAAVAIAEGGARGSNVMVRVDDVDAHYERARERGAQILGPPTDYPYGERQYTAVDPGPHVDVLAIDRRCPARGLGCRSIWSRRSPLARYRRVSARRLTPLYDASWPSRRNLRACSRSGGSG